MAGTTYPLSVVVGRNDGSTPKIFSWEVAEREMMSRYFPVDNRIILESLVERCVNVSEKVIVILFPRLTVISREKDPHFKSTGLGHRELEMNIL